MVSFISNPYVTESIRPKTGSIKWKTVCGIGMVSVYFITLSSNEKDIFDIYSAAVFKQRYVRKSNLCVIGIAESYEAATGLVQEMIIEAINKSGDYRNIRQYFYNLISQNKRK